jgi:23S rRNA (cytosine1962-C5)-methyltransferase
VHGSADGTPGLAVDRYADVAVIHADASHVVDDWLDALHGPLLEIGVRSAYVKVHPGRASHLSASDVQRLAPDTPAWGPPVNEVHVAENGVSYAVRPTAGLSVGLFVDMREVRSWLRRAAATRSVLNTFAYTCAFGVSATLGGASRVVNLDISRQYLAWGQANYRLNGLAVDRHDFVFGDAADWLERFGRRGERFDLVVVDPPTFSSTPFSVTRDYPRLVDAAARVVAPGGILLAATNHAATSDKRFEGWLRAGLASADRRARVLKSWHEPDIDFPAAAGRGTYLKVRALVLD